MAASRPPPGRFERLTSKAPGFAGGYLLSCNRNSQTNSPAGHPPIVRARDGSEDHDSRNAGADQDDLTCGAHLGPAPMETWDQVGHGDIKEVSRSECQDVG